MVFSSPIFILFFLPIVLIFGNIVKSGRNVILFLASLIFYAWGGIEYLPLLIFLIIFNWIIGIVIDAALADRKRDSVLILSLIINIGSLIYFKYTNFLISNISGSLGFLGISVPQIHQIQLPLGISFFTFHLISYVIDIHRRAARAQRNPINFGLYICFFPQLIAGPIIRYHDVASQLTERHVNLAKFASGIERFVFGLGKKILLANPFGSVADHIFTLSEKDLSTPLAWYGLISYTLQIYFDFSGYSDMAIGLGRMFGFEYLENFNYPYMSSSIKEFWRRWHISLSNWFRDYLYIPLGGNRKRPLRVYLNLMIVFFLCGFWHGASWNFVIWGLIHGVFLVLERGRLGVWLGGAPRVVGRAYTLAVVSFAWVFFRSDSLPFALQYLKVMAGFGEQHSPWPLQAFADQRSLLLLPLALVACTPLFSCLTRDWRARALQSFGQIVWEDQFDNASGSQFDRAMAIVRPPAVFGVLILSLIYIAGQTYNPFIYFRF